MSDAASAREPAGAGDEPKARGAVFMSDPSAEAEDVARLLRGAGHAVIDVPMSLLVARVAIQKPGVVVIDADVSGAGEAVAAIRALDGGDGVDVILLGVSSEEGGPEDGALAAERSGFFGRPVDALAVVRAIEARTAASRVRPSRPPAGSKRPGNVPSADVPVPPVGPVSLSPPPSAASPSSRSPPSPSGRRMPDRSSPIPPAPLSARPVISIQGSLSAELEALLSEAEHRVGSQLLHEVAPPTPEEELERVLPAELLASLDEPIEDDDEDSAIDGGSARLSPSSARVALRSPGQTNAGHVLTPAAGDAGPHTVAGSAFASPTTSWSRADLDESAQGEGARSFSETAGPAGPHSIGVAPTLAAPALAALSAGLAPEATPAPRDPGTGAVAGSGGPVTVIGAGDPPRLLASAVAGRATGTLSFEAVEALRRVVLREGDVVTAASSAEDETLLAFLTARGDIRREQVKDLAGKIAPFGRHAGAALVAHGLLRQDQLWTALRGHAEWVLGRTLSLARGTARIQAEAPGRLRQEPSVFGGSSGAEVLVEVARRVIAPEEAVQRLGGGGARITAGPAAALLAECALAAEERALVDEMHGLSVEEIMGRAAGPDAAAMLYMLTLLGVTDVEVALPAPSRLRGYAARPLEPAAQAREDDVLALDLSAVRERVRARHDLVCEGDYFTLLGVARDATGYEVRRAFLELRRAFEPSRILTPEIQDLEADVRTIVTVLDEAYEILRDGARRERYRRALDDAGREGP